MKLIVTENYEEMSQQATEIIIKHFSLNLMVYIVLQEVILP